MYVLIKTILIHVPNKFSGQSLINYYLTKVSSDMICPINITIATLRYFPKSMKNAYITELAPNARTDIHKKICACYCDMLRKTLSAAKCFTALLNLGVAINSKNMRKCRWILFGSRHSQLRSISATSVQSVSKLHS